MKKFSFLFMLLALLTITIPAFSDQKCEGPPELCAQVQELQQKLDEVKATSNQKITVAKQENDNNNTNGAMRAIAIAGAISVALKMLLGSIKKWKQYAKTEKQKTIIKLITIGVGFIALIATNIGMGLPLWQSLIIAGGGPGAMAVHDLHLLILVLLGKKKYSDVKEDLETPDDGPSSAKEVSKPEEPVAGMSPDEEVNTPRN